MDKKKQNTKKNAAVKNKKQTNKSKADSKEKISTPEAVQAAVPALPKRSCGIDIIKIMAAIFVIVTHFYLNTAFYTSIPIDNKGYIPPLIVLWIGYTAVPLFMITTGYLMKNKTLSAKYYSALIKILVFYLIGSFSCLKYRKDLGWDPDNWDLLKGVLEFSLCDNAWYVKMYLIMFMLIPFLNVMFNNLEGRKQHTILLVTVFLLFVAGPSLYIGRDPDRQIQLLPTYMKRVFPIAYYFLGCYIREYPPKRTLRNKLIFFSVFAVCLAIMTRKLYLDSYRNDEHLFHSGYLFAYDNYFVFILSAMVFLLLFDITIKSKAVTKVLSVLAQTTLLTYLISYGYDLKYYGAFNKKYEYPKFLLRFRHMYEIVPKIYFKSLVLSLIIVMLYTFCEKGVKRSIEEVKMMKAEDNNSR